MFNKHLFKVMAGFCAMILCGLVSLVVIDSFKDKAKDEQASASSSVQKTPVSTVAPQAKSASVKSTTSSKAKKVAH